MNSRVRASQPNRQASLHGHIYLALPLALTLAACSAHCEPKSSVPDNPAQLAALKNVQARAFKDCTQVDARCQYLLEQEGGGEIRIRTNFVFAEGGSGRCIQAAGDYEDAVYDSTGKFLRVDPQ